MTQFMPESVFTKRSRQIVFTIGFCSLALFFGELIQLSSALAQDTLPTQIQSSSGPLESQIQKWIGELDSSDIDLRETAAAQLYRAGNVAVPFLKNAASNSGEPEVKSRCNSLAIAIENDDLGNRIDQFLRELDPNKNHGMNNWPSFSKIVGPGRLSKRLFKEIIETHPVFAESSFEDQTKLLSEAEKVGREIVLQDNEKLVTETERVGRELLVSLRNGDEARIGDVVTLMFASILLHSNNIPVPRDIELTTSTMTRRTPFPQEVQGTALGTPLKRLFREWMKTASSEPQMVMITCMELGIEEGKSIARKYLEDKNIGPDLFEISMACLMRFAAPDDVAWIEPWTNDQRGLTPVFPISTNVAMRQAPFGVPRFERIEPDTPVEPKFEDVQAQYRDLALAAGFKALGEDVTKFYQRAQWHPYRGYIVSSLALPVADNSKRDAVIARWKELVELRKRLANPGVEIESPTLIPPGLTPPVEIKN